MRLCFAIALSICLATPGFAQNIRNERVQVKYLQLPLHPLRADVKTFKIEVELISPSSDDSRESLTSAIRAQAKLYGKDYREVQSSPDIQILVRLDRFIAEDPHIESRQVTTEKSDKTKVTTTVYSGVTNVAYPMMLRIVDKMEDKIVLETFVNGSDRFVKRSTSEGSSSQFARTQLEEMIKNLKKEMLNNSLSGLQSIMTSSYSFYPSTRSWSINYVETSKKANYDDVVAAKEFTKSALDSLSASIELTPASKANLAAAIEKWQSILKESDLENRKARIDKKVSQAILENLAYCNYFLRNFTEASRYMLEAKERNKQQWQYDLESQINDTKKRLDSNFISYQ